VLGSYKFYEAVREGWGKQSIIHRFLQDTVWAFILPFGLSISLAVVPDQLKECFLTACLATNLFCMRFIQGSLSSVAYS
jgi:hypothetical protein